MFRFLGIRTEDRRDAVLGFLTLALVMAAHAVVEAARDSLFLTRLPVEQLPWAYLAIAVLAVGAAQLNQRLVQRFNKRWVLAVTLLLAGATNFGFWILLRSGASWVFFGLYIWSGLAATVLVVQFWLLLGAAVTVTQAKRVFSLVAAGGLIGATAGSLIADLGVRVFDPRELLVAAGGILVVSAVVPAGWRFVPDASSPPRRNERPKGLGTSYLRRLLLLVLLSTVTLTGVDYLFKAVVAENVSPELLPSFFTRFYLGLNFFALLFQVVISGWMLRVLGVNRALLVLPSLLLLFLGSMAAFPAALLPVLLMKGADGALRHSLHRTATEVLYLPLSADLRDRFKAIVDAVGQRGGQGLASLGILAAVYLGANNLYIGIGVAVLAVAWLSYAVGIKGHYLDLFRTNLREGTIRTRVELADLDLHSLEAMVAALNSDQDEEVLAALDLFQEHDKVPLIPVLVLYHPSKEVVLRALELFASHGHSDFTSVARRLLRQDDQDIRAAALQAISAVEAAEELLQAHVDDESPLVEVTALVALIARSVGNEAELRRTFDARVRASDPAVVVATAKAIRMQRDPEFIPVLLELASHPARQIRLEVARAMLAMPDPAYLPALLPLLQDAQSRPVARQVFLALGDDALTFLDEALSNPATPRATRRHIPRSIHRFEASRAAEILMKHLNQENDDAVRFKILRGLGRLVSEHPDLALDRQALRRACERTVHRWIRSLAYRLATEQAHRDDPALETTGGTLLLVLLKEQERSLRQWLFRILGLINPGEDFELLYQGLRRSDRRARAQSRELLENAISGALRDAILAMVDDLPAGERLQRARAALGLSDRTPTYEERLLTMLEDRSETVQSIAAYHIAELGLETFADRLDEARPGEPSHLGEVIDRALGVLSIPPGTLKGESSAV
ncbi:MAG: MFS transporter [Myxococcota bacterium]